MDGVELASTIKADFTIVPTRLVPLIPTSLRRGGPEVGL